MKKSYFIILILLISTISSFGQKGTNWTDFDTLQVFPDKLHVDYKTFVDSNLTEQGQAFLYPDTIEIRKSRWLPGFIKTEVSVSRVVLHGEVKSQWTEGKYRIGKYENGKKITVIYYSPDGNEITYLEFYEGFRSHWDPEQGTGDYIIH